MQLRVGVEKKESHSYQEAFEREPVIQWRQYCSLYEWIERGVVSNR